MLMRVSTLQGGVGNVASLQRGLKDTSRRGLLGLGRFGLGDVLTSPDGMFQSTDGGQVWLPIGSSSQPVVYNAPAAPVFQNCDPRDVACVVGNSAAAVGYQQTIGVDQASADYLRCIANNTGDAICRARWPVGYSGEVPFLNLTPDQQRAQMVTPGQASAQYFTNAGITPPPAGVPDPPPAATPLPAKGNVNPGRVTIANVTRPGQKSFQVGDSFQVQISGASPNQPVTASASQNGTSAGTSSFGNTDSSGSFLTSGVMGVAQIGNWVEAWYVAGVQSGTASFTVAQGPGPSASQSTTPPDTTAGGNTIVKTPPANPSTGLVPTAPVSSPLDFLAGTVGIGSFQIPVWALAGAAVVGVAMFAGSHR